MTIRGVLAIVVVLSAARQGLGLDITACNTLVADNEVGVLQTDMSCGGAFIAVGLGENSTLDMNGHSITGTFPTGRAVECRGIRCTILSSNGTGRIGGGDFDAVQIGFFTSNVARLRISDVDLHDARGGLHGSGNVLFERDTRVVAQRVAAHGNADFGIWVTRFTGAHIDASHNGVVGVSADKLRGTTITTSSNGASGLFGDRISAKGLISNDNGDAGVRAVSASLKNATITGNNGFGMGIDVATLNRPHAHNVTCGKSQVLAAVAGANWGICTGD